MRNLEKINADFDKRVVVHSEKMEWHASPMKGVDRRPLDRIGGEVARATSIVRYAPGSEFSPHIHTGGEEFVVLDGVFQDEHGDFPVGSYIRNPPQSKHKPGSDKGCIIFVKLWQFDLTDRNHVRLRSDLMSGIPHRDIPDATVTPLYRDQYESVSIHEWLPNSTIHLDTPKGAELLVLQGGFKEQSDSLSKHSWLRVPEGSKITAQTGESGARVWIKEGHLSQVARDVANLQQHV